MKEKELCRTKTALVLSIIKLHALMYGKMNNQVENK